MGHKPDVERTRYWQRTVRKAAAEPASLALISDEAGATGAGIELVLAARMPAAS